ncbi:energy transducer TonB [Spirosoma endbachense]|nr:energy transducer TonB [Spirosoma endbachense]
MTPSQSNTGAINPVFPGGALALQRFVDQTKQPVSPPASETVFVEFVVNVDGSVSDYTVLKGAGMEADLEAVRIVSIMPEWTPGTIDGEPARFKFVLPIPFKD